MLLAHMLKDVCGCKVVEGQGQMCSNSSFNNDYKCLVAATKEIDRESDGSPNFGPNASLT